MGFFRDRITYFRKCWGESFGKWGVMISPLLTGLDHARSYIPPGKEWPIIQFFPSIPLYVWAIIFLISIIIVIGEGGYRVWSKERQSNAITPLEIQAIAFDPPHDLYGLCLKIANPASNSINMSGIRAIFADGKFEDFDLAGLELMPAKEMNGGSISLNPGDYALLTIFKAKSQIYFTSIAFPFKSQAGGLKAVSSKSEAYGELRIIVTVENAPAREVKVTWCETDGRFIADTSQP